MKNNNDQQYDIGKARATQMRRVSTDMLVDGRVVEQNAAKLTQQPRQRRRRNYAKKIMNDQFIFSV